MDFYLNVSLEVTEFNELSGGSVNDDEGIAPHQNIDMVITHAGGYGKCTFTRKDARNHIENHRKEKLKPLLGKDVLVLMEYF